jgi:RNA-directed DNA polymerase
MAKVRQDQPARVACGPMQAGDIRARWAWVQASAWSDRMLAALEQGVKGDVWFSLIDKVYAPANLLAAFTKAAKNKGAAGVDHVTVEEFKERQDENLARLHGELKGGTYRPQAIRRTLIDKPGSKEKRPLGIPTVRDRVVQGAVRHVLEPIFEKEFAEHSYGFRPNRGCKPALARVDALIKKGYRYTVDIDLKAYFDTIPHDKLLEKVRKRVQDGRVLGLIEAFLKACILYGMQSWNPVMGAPQGAVLSPLLSNLYLNDLDHLVAGRGYEMTRYADDMVIQCRTPQEAEAALVLVREWVEAHGLTLHPTKTKIVDVDTDGFDFLGYHFRRRFRIPRKKSLDRVRDAIREKTRRKNGHSLECIITDVNRTLRGWFGYFKHSARTPLGELDGWIRMRLRSILRRRRRGKGRGRGRDHQRWPNAFFTERGLFSLKDAHVSICQSPKG